MPHILILELFKKFQKGKLSPILDSIFQDWILIISQYPTFNGLYYDFFSDLNHEIVFLEITSSIVYQ